MHYLADPALVRWTIMAWLFVVVMGLALPVAALSQHRDGQLAARATRPAIYASAAVTHAILLLLVWLVLRGQPFAVLAPYRFTPWHALVAIAALALGLLPLVERLHMAVDSRTRLIAPRTPREHAMFLGVSVSAGIAEEMAYRGLLFTLVASLAGSWWIAALACAALFGVVHLFQGWKGAGLASLMGLREHLVVGLTGTIFVAIVVHILHDAIAGIVIGRRARREEGIVVS